VKRNDILERVVGDACVRIKYTSGIMRISSVHHMRNLKVPDIQNIVQSVICCTVIMITNCN